MSIAVSLDGVLAPIDGANNATDVRAKAAAEGWVRKGPAGYREASCATVSFCDEKGDLLGAIRMARAPETQKATLKQMLTAETSAILARRPDLKLVKVADGAARFSTFHEWCGETIVSTKRPAAVARAHEWTHGDETPT